MGLPGVSLKKAFSFVRKPRKPEKWKIVSKVDESGSIQFKVGFLYIMWCLLVNINDSLYKHYILFFFFFKNDFCSLKWGTYIWWSSIGHFNFGFSMYLLSGLEWNICFVSLFGCKMELCLLHDLNMFLKHQ